MKGPRGIPGKAGPNGMAGLSGAKGIAGQMGVKGDKGEPGTSSYTAPSMSAFSARKDTQQVSSGTETVTYNYEDIDIGNDFNPSTGVFTCRIQGLYYFSFTCLPYHNYSFYIYLQQNGTNKAKIYYNSGSRHVMQSQSVILTLQAGDEVKLVAQSPSYFDNSSSLDNIFNGYLIHAI